MFRIFFQKFEGKNLIGENRMVFETPEVKTEKVDSPKPAARETPAPVDTKRVEEGEKQAREKQKEGDEEQVASGISAELESFLKNIEAAAKTPEKGNEIASHYQRVFVNALQTQHDGIEKWEKDFNKKLLTVKGEKIQEKTPAETVDALYNDARLLAPESNKTDGPASIINVEAAVQSVLKNIDTSKLSQPERTGLEQIFRTYFNTMNAEIQRTKQEIKLSHLSDKEKKVWETWKPVLKGCKDDKERLQRISEQMKDRTPAQQQEFLKEFLAIKQKMDDVEADAETVAQELKDGSFLGVLTSLLESIAKLIEQWAGKLGLDKIGDKAKEKVREEAGKIIEKNPLGDQKFLVTSWIGHREAPETADGKKGSTEHKGIDVSVPEGTILYAGAKVKKVAEVGSGGKGGNFVKLELQNGDFLYYMHLKEGSIKVNADQTDLSPDTVIAETGNTGTSTGPHLHVEIRDQHGNIKNPLPYFKKFVVQAEGNSTAMPTDDEADAFCAKINTSKT